MQRILILGCGGSGKSTLARTLGQLLDLPVIHLDRLFWNPGWIPSSPEHFDPLVAESAQGDRWVIDGNYTRTLAPRLAVADTLIYLDMPRWLCMWRILWRTFIGQLSPDPRPRKDLPPECRDQLDVEFVEWVWTYRARDREKKLRLLDSVRGQPNAPRVIVLRNPREVRRFVDELRARRTVAASNEAPALETAERIPA